ncbi:O-methyltransferase [Janthinobacterium sp.]|uniref:O-methyltransferase n=1 Tax=Janthinobacterium sp. TaxID=1871054 RepID=UPI00293D6CDF|nr:O-methyltransferase [Janthinobacterium sp.]
MDAIEHLLAELEDFGAANDARHDARAKRMLNITRDTGQLLAVLVQAGAARRVLEIGTSNGYSTLWLARAARALGGRVTTLEYAADKHALALANFARAGLQDSVQAVLAEAGGVLAETPDGAYDLVFLDSERSQYLAWWPHIARALRPGGVLVVDNATSHYGEMAAFLEGIDADPRYTSCLVPVGKGEFIAVKSA